MARPGRRVALELGVPRGETTVDLCSGDGYFTAPLAQAASGKVYALEMDPETVGRAREYLSACGGENCVVIEDDARNLATYVSEPLGFALVANTFHGIPEPDRRGLVHKVYDILRPGGRLASIPVAVVVAHKGLTVPCGAVTFLTPNPGQHVALSGAGDRLEALYVLAMYTGLRRSEILGLKWAGVDFDAGILSVQRSLQRGGTSNPPKRNKSRRTVKLTGQAVEALKTPLHRGVRAGAKPRRSVSHSCQHLLTLL